MRLARRLLIFLPPWLRARVVLALPERLERLAWAQLERELRRQRESER